jgi:hypothetical protein
VHGAGLVKGEGFAVDASVMAANASRYDGKLPNKLAWADAQRQKRAVAECLAGLEAEAGSPAEDGGKDRGDGSDGERHFRPDRKPPKVTSPSDPSSAWTAGRLVAALSDQASHLGNELNAEVRTPNCTLSLA